MTDDHTFDCSGCGDILTPGIPHECPVLGTTVRIVIDPLEEDADG